jgi:hypothetical protein
MFTDEEDFERQTTPAYSEERHRKTPFAMMATEQVLSFSITP